MTIDLHGIQHRDVTILLENTILPLTINKFPVNIITGNSNLMKQIVIEFLITHNFSYIIGDSVNKGYIKVLNYESSDKKAHR